jgi:hypothetical protein
VRTPAVSWFLAGIAGLRGSLSALLGLLTLIFLAILVVWPLWYLATAHTRIYSLAILLLTGVSLVLILYARIRRFLVKARFRGIKTLAAGEGQASPEEPRE